MPTRRELLKTALLSGAALAAAPLWAQAAPAPASGGPFSLPLLPYAYEALEPYIDAQTMQIHHDKHHAGYVKNLNAAVADLPDPRRYQTAQGVSDAGLLITGMLLGTSAAGLPDPSAPLFTTIRNNGGGHYNHSVFWRLMKPGGGGRPTADLASAIDRRFGSYTAFQEAFTKAALGQFGSGWAWLSLAPGGVLRVESTPNQDSPLMLGRVPLLGIDVWEHAYYLKYQNKRAEYIAAWYNTLNWDDINARFDAARKAA